MKEMVYKERPQEPSVLYEKETEEGYKILILSLGTHPTAYVGVPKDSVIAGLESDDFYFLSVHGGITFAQQGEGLRDENYYWYGWDYAHAGDQIGELEGKKWTTEEILEEAEQVVFDLYFFERVIERNYVKKK